MDAAALFKKSLHAASSDYEKEKKNLYNVLLALAFVYLWLYYRKEMWRICDRFSEKKMKFLNRIRYKGKEFI